MLDGNPRYGDVCDSGTHPAQRVAVAPAMAISDDPGGLLAAYRCPRCHYAWTCGWGLVPGRVLPPGPGPDETGERRELAALLSEQAAIARARRLLARTET